MPAWILLSWGNWLQIFTSLSSGILQKTFCCSVCAGLQCLFLWSLLWPERPGKSSNMPKGKRDTSLNNDWNWSHACWFHIILVILFITDCLKQCTSSVCGDAVVYYVDKIPGVTIQMKATEQYLHVVLFIMLYKVVLTFESMDENRKVWRFR